MHHHYNDIKKRIKKEPKWYDCHGVPRYEDFTPNQSPNVYAREVVLVKIACQYCDEGFLVEINWGYRDYLLGRGSTDHIHYGDPPNHDCTGDTMNCIDLEIKEFWIRDGYSWKHLKEKEIKLGE